MGTRRLRRQALSAEAKQHLKSGKSNHPPPETRKKAAKKRITDRCDLFVKFVQCLAEHLLLGLLREDKNLTTGFCASLHLFRIYVCMLTACAAGR
jgi:hypothetical protein